MNKDGLSFILLSGIIVFFSASSFGETSDDLSRPVLSTYSVEIGRETALSTYLTPLRHHGPHVALSGQWSKRLPADPTHLSMHFSADVAAAFMHPYRLTSKMQDVGLGFDWTMLHTWHPADNISISGGGGCGLAAGALLRMSNSNNPAAAYADVHISLAARGAWAGKLGRLPVVISENVNLPSLSVFFSPEYAEPYYAIYLGYRDGLVNTGWWGNHFSIDNLINARLVLGRRSLDIGYRFKVDSSWVNHINTQRVSHSFVIGVTIGVPAGKTINESLL